MADPFIGEIRLLPFNWAPQGFAACDGAILIIQQNQALYTLIGAQYGGNGSSTFALPDLQGRVPIHANGACGQTGGEEAHPLTTAEIPNHTHTLSAAAVNVNVNSPSGATWGNFETGKPFEASQAPNAWLNSAALAPPGTVAHNNMQPYLALNFVIALTGIFPSRN